MDKENNSSFINKNTPKIVFFYLFSFIILGICSKIFKGNAHNLSYDLIVFIAIFVITLLGIIYNLIKVFRGYKEYLDSLYIHLLAFGIMLLWSIL
jgi:Na+-driven multidrug efflux pump